MRKRAFFYLHIYSMYFSTCGLILLAMSTGWLRSICGDWTFEILIAATMIWIKLIKRLFRKRPAGRPGIWTTEMEIQRRQAMTERWSEPASQDSRSGSRRPPESN
jgi:hypothetical protein